MPKATLRPLRIAVGIATAGRRDLLTEILAELAQQTRTPDDLFICPAGPSDFDESAIVGRVPYRLSAVSGSRGLTPQRNAILRAVKDCDVVVFFDDDFVPCPFYLEELEKCFAEHEGIVAMSGRVIADDVKGPGLALATAQALLKSYPRNSLDVFLTDQFNAYGCNMAIRLSPVRQHGLRFDENLPLYGWLEDVDFCRQLAPHGRIAKNERMIGVHLGTKGGRTSGVRFGYSQVANPLYLWRKGTLGLGHALRQMSKNGLANLWHSIRPEPWVDRRGRVRGNLKALADLLRGRLDPRRIVEFT
jgi:GT2 family glycosyltransferase